MAGNNNPPIPVSVSGARDTLEINQARRVVDMADTIIMLEDDKKALMTFLDSLGIRKVTNHRFDWLTDEIVPKTHRANGIIAAPAGQYAAETIDLSLLGEELYVRPNDILKVQETGEVMKVLSAANMNAVLVSRDLEGIAPAATTADALVTKIGNSVQENSSLRLNAPLVPVFGGGRTVPPLNPGTVDPSAGQLALGSDADPLNSLTVNTVDNWNFTQTFRNPVGLSRREMQAELYGGPDRPHQRMKKLLEHCEEIENAFWHGIRGVATDPNTKGMNDYLGTDTLTGGIIQGIDPANVFAIGGPLGEEVFNDFLRTFSRYGNTSRKVFFASRFVCDVISSFARVSQPTTQPHTTTRRSVGNGVNQSMGTHVSQYVAGVGFTADIKPAHALEGLPGDLPAAFGGGTPDVWDGYGVLIDPENVKCAKYGDAYMKLQVDLQLPDQDGVVDAYISDVGLQWGNPGHHGLITGITG